MTSSPSVTVVSAMGRTVEVTLTGPRARPLEALLRAAWGHLRVTGATAATIDARIELSTSEEDAPEHLRRHLSLLTTSITQRCIDLNAPEHLQLHAAALATPDGATTALIGHSGAGKTTAARHLGRRLAYLTDEATAIRPDGTVLPYPKPLSIRVDDEPVKSQRAPAELGLMPVASGQPCRIAAFVLLDRDPERTGGPAVRTLPLTEGLLALIGHTSHLQRLPAPLRTLAELVVMTGGVRCLSYAEAADIASLDAGAGERQSFRAVAVDPPRSAGSPARGQLRRAPVRDAIEIDGDLVVLGDDRAVSLTGVAPAIWLQAADWVDPASLAQAAIARHGPHPDARARVDSAIETLCEERVLERSGG